MRKLFLIASFSALFSGFDRTTSARSAEGMCDDRGDTQVVLHWVLTPVGWYHGTLEATGIGR